jgi:hypothetical protein
VQILRRGGALLCAVGPYFGFSSRQRCRRAFSNALRISMARRRAVSADWPCALRHSRYDGRSMAIILWRLIICMARTSFPGTWKSVGAKTRPVDAAHGPEQR